MFFERKEKPSFLLHVNDGGLCLLLLSLFPPRVTGPFHFWLSNYVLPKSEELAEMPFFARVCREGGGEKASFANKQPKKRERGGAKKWSGTGTPPKPISARFAFSALRSVPPNAVEGNGGEKEEGKRKKMPREKGRAKIEK